MNFNLQFKGFQEREPAIKIAKEIEAIFQEVYKILDITKLDGMTVTYFYEEDLKNLDRGIENLNPLKPSKEHVAGVAMAVPIIKDGIIKKHIVINASYIEGLFFDNEKEYKKAKNLVFHEFCHVHDTAIFDRCFPDIILNECPYRHPYDENLFKISYSVWSEYIACRLSAFTCENEILNYYNECFVEMLKKAKKHVGEAISKYRNDNIDLSELLEISHEYYGNLFKYSAYLIGHLHGINKTLQNALPETFEILEKSYFKEGYNFLENSLLEMYSTYPEWQDIEVYRPLMNTYRDFLSKNGLVFQRNPNNQLYIAVPE